MGGGGEGGGRGGKEREVKKGREAGGGGEGKMNAIAKLAAADRRKLKEKPREEAEGKRDGEEEGGKRVEEGKEAG